MKEWFITNYALIKFWELLVVAVITVPLIVVWVILMIKDKNKKR